MPSAFERALAFTLRYEGGYVDHPHDPGGETNYGISRRRYPDEDIRGMTRTRAAQLYKRDFWDKQRCGEMPPLIAWAVFDWSVHSPLQTVVHALQKELGGLKIDGIIGPQTLRRAKDAGRTPMLDANLARALTLRRLKFLARLVKRQPDRRLTFLTGWMARVYALGSALTEAAFELSRPESAPPFQEEVVRLPDS